ncbi:hypothetical protein HGRIS_011738 [Hohenbuehelia grisea]|uniref:Uncharacterized protein n=1 Tax=Hohenbuehelia grisea TaxID=104357 RepID=A0ABR3JW12_9AGAR
MLLTRVFASVALFAALVAAAPQTGVGLGEECGDVTGPKVPCAPGLICHVYNDYTNYVCVKPRPLKPTTKPPPPKPTGVKGVGESCGDYNGPNAQCAPGLYCHPFDDNLSYYCVVPRHPH